MISLILLSESFLIFNYMGRVSPSRLPCRSPIMKNYISKEGRKVLSYLNQRHMTETS